MAKPPRTSIPPLLQTPVYLAIRSALAGLTALPPSILLGAGKRLGEAWAVAPPNRRRLERAVGNIRVAFPDWDEDQARRCAIACHGHFFRVVGMEMAYTPRLMNEDAWARRLALDDISPALRTLLACGPVILITGHVGNWELLGTTLALLGFPMHALYRPLDLPPLDRYVRQTRRRQGLEVVDKFGALRQLPELVASGAPIGMVADQNAGDRGLFVPFFGRLASSYKSIGLLAIQFNATVVCGFARRLEPDDPEAARSGGLAYRMELVDRFGPGDWSTHPDPLFYLTARWRRAVETMVRRAPEQYLWMHRVWRSRPRHERLGRPFPPALLDKLRALPWMTADGLDRLVDRSARDARLLAETGQDKLS